MNAPIAIAAILATVGLLLGGSVLLTRLVGRIGVPVALGFILLGILAGDEGIIGIQFESYTTAFRLGVAALVLILFAGGLNTPAESLREVIVPSALLATAGVALTAGILAIAAHFAGMSWSAALLIGAIVSSTDAAAVFASLRGTGLSLKTRVARTLEAESGLNDPVAVILTLALTALALGGTSAPHALWAIPREALLQLVVGAAAGVVTGRLGRRMLLHARLDASGLYPVLTIAIALTAYGLTSIAHGSGFLAVYIAAVLLGRDLPYRAGIVRVHDALAWVGQIAMFIVLGLLVSPTHLIGAAGPGLFLAAVLTLVARPVAVALTLVPFGYSPRETLFMSVVGLRGAVPIVLATIPVIAGVHRAESIFDTVFFIVVVNAVVPGSVVAYLARWLGVTALVAPEATTTVVVESSVPTRNSVRSYFIDKALPVCGAVLSDVPFPPQSAATMIVRGAAIIAADGSTRLREGDHVYVLSTPETEGTIQLLFGRGEVEE